MQKYRETFASVLKKLGFPDLGGPHVMRHSGACHLVQHEQWELADLQVRGRWGSLRSVLHYLKPHLLTRNEERTPEEFHEQGNWIWEDPRVRMGLSFPLSEEPVSQQLRKREEEMPVNE